MKIKEEINAILERRAEKIPLLQKSMDKIIKISDELQKVDSIRSKMLENASKLAVSGDVYNKIEELNTTDYMRAFDAYKRKYEEIIQRFSRRELSIAVVGAARQGKSMLLQSISSLDDAVIPAFTNNDCTGATSVIKNVPGMPVSAQVSFRTESEMVKTVQKYLDTIFGEGQESMDSFEGIGRLPLDKLRQKMEVGSPETVKFEHLSKYVKHFDEWSPMVRKGTIIITDKSEIQQYVAQHNGKSESDPDRKEYFYYLAVKEVTISCEFQNADAGSIVLRDTIGLGDTSLGIEEKMFDAIGRYSDAAVIVRRPEASTGRFDDSDVAFYRKMKDTFKNRNMDKWLFWLINKTSDSSPYKDNSDRCKAFSRKISEQKWDIAGYYIVNVADHDEVNKHFLNSLLETLVKNMDAIDEGILMEAEEEAERLYEQYQKVQKAVEQILLSEVKNKVDKTEFLNTKWKAFYEKGLMKLIKEFRNELEKNKDAESEKFRECIEQILERSQELLPSEETLYEEIISGGRNRPSEVYGDHLDALRTNFTEQFLKIDELIFDQQVKEIKERIVDIFAEDSGGRLKHICPIQENKEKSEWLRDLAQNIFDKKRYNQFKIAFCMLADFQLTVRGFLMHRIRARIDRLNEIGYNTHESADKEIAKEIRRTLSRKLKDVREELEVTLKADFYKDPNRIFYAIIAEFYDRINFSYTESGEQDVESAWKSLYGDNCHKIWMDDFRETQEISVLYEEWYGLSNKLGKYSRQDFKLKLY